MNLFRPELADLNPVRRAHAQADHELASVFLQRLAGESPSLKKVLETTQVNFAMAERVLDGHSNN